MVQFERIMIVSYRLSIVTTVLSLTCGCNVCHRMYPDTQVNKKWTWQYLGRKGVDRCKPNFIMIWERHGTGAAVCKRNLVDFFCRLSTMYKRDRQTDRHRQTDTETDHGIANIELMPIVEVARSSVT